MKHYDTPPLSLIGRAALALAVAALVLPMVPAVAPTPSPSTVAYVQRLPDAAIDATLQVEMALGRAYLAVAYAARDLSAAVYGSIALQYVSGIYVLGNLQQRAYALMGNSMTDGATQVGGAAAAVGEWYQQSSAQIDARLQLQPTR